MPELLWFLLPVAAVSGWLAAKRTLRADDARMADCGATYYKGLNYLLNEQPDKAIDVFTAMLEVDSGTVESHMALGSLFRRRGEVDRAIHLHQNLVDRSSLNTEQRGQAVLELGRDYLRAGLYDRAESWFSQLVDDPQQAEPALEYLLTIYEQEKEWGSARDVARRLGKLAGRPVATRVAQYCCELAQDQRATGDLQQALTLLEEALAVDRDCVRATLLKGELLLVQGDTAGALQTWQQLEKQDAAYLPEVIPAMLQCYHQQGLDTQAREYLESLPAGESGIEPVLALVDLLIEQGDTNRASEVLSAALVQQPSLRGLERLISMETDHVDPRYQQPFVVLRGLISQLLDKRPTYQCHHCGFAGKTLHWHCPGCRHWGTVKPVVEH